MLNKIQKGFLNPCPVCGCDNIDWSGYRYITLACNHCGFEMYPENDFASEAEYFREWNSLGDIDTIIKNQDKVIALANEQIEIANKTIKECSERKEHYIWTKERIKKAKENFS